MTDIKWLFTVNLNSFPDRHCLPQSAWLGESLSNKEFCPYLLYLLIYFLLICPYLLSLFTVLPCRSYRMRVWDEHPCALNLTTNRWDTQGRQTKAINRRLWQLLWDLRKFLTWHYWQLPPIITSWQLSLLSKGYILEWRKDRGNLLPKSNLLC